MPIQDSFSIPPDERVMKEMLPLNIEKYDFVVLACNMMDTDELLTQSQLLEFEQEKLDDVPEWVYDVHTIKGKLFGKTKEQFMEEEMLALKNGVISLFE